MVDKIESKSNFSYLYTMAKSSKEKTPKPRKEQYEQKVSFPGTFEQLLGLTIKHADKKSTQKK